MFSFVSFVRSKSVPTSSNRYRNSLSIDLSVEGVSHIIADGLSVGPLSEELSKLTCISGVAAAVWGDGVTVA